MSAETAPKRQIALRPGCDNAAAVLSDLLAVQGRFASVHIVEQIERYNRHPKRSLDSGDDQGLSSK